MRYEVLYSLMFPKIRKVVCLVVWLHYGTKFNLLIYWYLIGYYTERAWKIIPHIPIDHSCKEQYIVVYLFPWPFLYLTMYPVSVPKLKNSRKGSFSLFRCWRLIFPIDICLDLKNSWRNLCLFEIRVDWYFSNFYHGDWWVYHIMFTSWIRMSKHQQGTLFSCVKIFYKW